MKNRVIALVSVLLMLFCFGCEDKDYAVTPTPEPTPDPVDRTVVTGFYTRDLEFFIKKRRSNGCRVLYRTFR